MIREIHYSEHMLKRMAQRGISKETVELILDKGEWRRGNKPHSFEVTYIGIVLVVYAFHNDRKHNIVTCKLDREHTYKAEQLRNELQIGFLEAVKMIVANNITKHKTNKGDKFI